MSCTMLRWRLRPYVDASTAVHSGHTRDFLAEGGEVAEGVEAGFLAPVRVILVLGALGGPAEENAAAGCACAPAPGASTAGDCAPSAAAAAAGAGSAMLSCTREAAAVGAGRPVCGAGR